MVDVESSLLSIFSSLTVDVVLQPLDVGLIGSGGSDFVLIFILLVITSIEHLSLQLVLLICKYHIVSSLVLSVFRHCAIYSGLWTRQVAN